jgi:ketosteroid isomerase-like protein
MRITILLFAFVIITACNESKTDTKAEGEKLMQTSRDWSKVAQTDSIDQILSYWDDSAVVMLPGQPALKGKQAIREMIEGSSKIPGFKISWEPISASISTGGDMGYLIEQTRVSMNDSTGKAVTEYNKAVTVWKKKSDGSWKNVVDTYNSDPH